MGAQDHKIDKGFKNSIVRFTYYHVSFLNLSIGFFSFYKLSNVYIMKALGKLTNKNTTYFCKRYVSNYKIMKFLPRRLNILLSSDGGRFTTDENKVLFSTRLKILFLFFFSKVGFQILPFLDEREREREPKWNQELLLNCCHPNSRIQGGKVN